MSTPADQVNTNAADVGNVLPPITVIGKNIDTPYTSASFGSGFANILQEWLKPPKLYATLGITAVALYLFTQRKKKRSRR